MNKPTEFEQKMMDILNEKRRTVNHINALVEKYRKLELQEEQLETDEFIRTGSTKIKFSIDITYDDLLKDLIKESKNKNQ